MRWGARITLPIAWSHGPRTALNNSQKRVKTVCRCPTYNSYEIEFGETQDQKDEVGTMCFRPSPVKRNDSSDSITCGTCGMPVNLDPGETSTTCPYCGDPVQADQSSDFSDIDPSYSTRII